MKKEKQATRTLSNPIQNDVLKNRLQSIFRSFRKADRTDIKSVEDALDRLQFLAFPEFYQACLFLLCIECERCVEANVPPSVIRAERIVQAVEAKAAAGMQGRLAYWINQKLTTSYPLGLVQRLTAYSHKINESRNTQCITLVDAGRHEEALAVAESIEDTEQQSKALCAIAADFARLSQKETADPLFKRALDLIEIFYAYTFEDADESGYGGDYDEYLQVKGKCTRYMVGKMAEIGWFKRAEELSNNIEDEWLRSEAFCNIAKDLAASGHLSESFEAAARSGPHQSIALGCIAETIAKSGNFFQALNVFSKANDLAAEQQGLWKSKCLLSVAAGLVIIGTKNKARKVAEQASEVIIDSIKFYEDDVNQPADMRIRFVMDLMEVGGFETGIKVQIEPIHETLDLLAQYKSWFRVLDRIFSSGSIDALLFKCYLNGFASSAVFGNNRALMMRLIREACHMVSSDEKPEVFLALSNELALLGINDMRDDAIVRAIVAGSDHLRMQREEYIKNPTPSLPDNQPHAEEPLIPEEWPQENTRISNILGISVEMLRLVRLKVIRAQGYDAFRIPKRRKGFRVIHSPHSDLAHIQRRIKECILDPAPGLPSCVTAFRPGVSIRDNAMVHCDKAVVVKFDLEDFFPSISFTRVMGIFHSLGFPTNEARMLANLTTVHLDVSSSGPVVKSVSRSAEAFYQTKHLVDLLHEYPVNIRLLAYRWNYGKISRALALRMLRKRRRRGLPQGASTSPQLANLAAVRLDLRLRALGESMGFAYTRYADDLTFSSNERLAKVDALTSLVDEIVVDCGFRLNGRKTKIMRAPATRRVTGLIVNTTTPKVPRSMLRKVRAMLHQQAGGKLSEADIHRLRGYLSFVRMIDKEQADLLLDC
ncbi:hypothetical protein HQ447_17005 [bacterium]|nr:hypothetical protein [bacterium]